MTTQAEATLLGWLRSHAAARPDAPAYRVGDRQISYAQLERNVLALAAGLQSQGLAKGDIVAVQLPNTSTFVELFLAVTACGGIVQTLHVPYRQAELRHLLEHSRAKIAVGLSDFKGHSPAAEMVAMAEDIPDLRTVIAVGGPVDRAIEMADLGSAQAAPELPDVNPDDEFLLLYTSGTTASPKGVPHRYRGFLGNAERSADQMGFGPGDTLLSVAPYTHLYGLFVMHMCLAVGATQALLPAFDPADFLPILIDTKPQGIFAAPAHFAPFCASAKLRAEHLSGTRVICLSGTTVPPALAEQIDDLMADGCVVQLWGMSELQAGAFGRPDDPKSTRLTTAGRASEATELRVVDADGQALSAGEEGELQVRGPSVFAGYLNNERETEAAFAEEGWFRTGDLAILDRDGFLTLTGRVKEIINRGGVKYNPVDIEALLMSHQAIEACAIVPYPDPHLGERACLCVQLRAGAELELDEVTALLSDQGIAKYKWPERLEIVDAMPLTPTRKIMRGTLKQQLI